MKMIFNTKQERFASIKVRTLKIVRYCMIWILAVMLTSCNKNLEVDISPDTIYYNTAECGYYGDLFGNAFFNLDLHDSSNPNIGIFIMGFCTLPSSFANFKLDAGTYRIAETGAVRTLFPGMITDGVRIGTYFYDFTASKFTFITEGSLTVALSGNTYTISANFTGEDATTRKAVNDIKISFTGQVRFTDERDLNTSPVNSTYSAVGTPKWLSAPRSAAWNGTLEPVENINGKWYEVSNWGNEDITIYLDDVGGKIVIDDYTKVASNSTHDGYFRVAFIEGSNLVLLDDGLEDYYVTYDPDSRKLTFPSKVTFNGKEHQAVVGIAAYNNTTKQPQGVFSDFYADVTLQLTPVSSSSAMRQTNNAVNFMEILQWSSNSVIGAKKTNTAAEKSDKIKLQTIPLKEFTATSSSQMIKSQKEVQKK